jgi:D-arabinose 1-dehydrogenase-like Zn-dependent alcohol dehydrogenase
LQFRLKKGVSMAKGTMKAFEIQKRGEKPKKVERQIPQPTGRQVQIRVEACGVCHSDSFLQEGGLPGLQYPLIPGHEVIGVIEDQGPDVNAMWKVGDRVGVGWHAGHCFHCSPCRHGDLGLCEVSQVPGITFDGGYAEFMVAREEGLARVPTELTSVEAAPLLCAGVTTFNALRNSGARPGDVVAVQGIGGLGHLGVQFAARAGFFTVAIGRTKKNEGEAREFGAKAYIAADEQDAAKELRALGGAKVILATAPSAKSMEPLLKGLATDGKLLMVGIGAERLGVGLELIQKRASVLGWPSGIAVDSEETMLFAKNNGVRPKIEKFEFDRAAEAYEQMLTGKAHYRAVIVMKR